MNKLLEKWDLKSSEAEFSAVTDGVWRVKLGEETYMLKRRATRTRVWEEYDLLSWLTASGQPISPLLYTREEIPWAEYQGGFYVLYSYVEGTPGNELVRFDASVAREAGAVLASLHKELASYSSSGV